MVTSNHTNHCYACAEELGPIVVNMGGFAYCSSKCAGLTAGVERAPSSPIREGSIVAGQADLDALYKRVEALEEWQDEFAGAIVAGQVGVLKRFANQPMDEPQPNTLTAEQVESLSSCVQAAFERLTEYEEVVSVLPRNVSQALGWTIKARQILGMGEG